MIKVDIKIDKELRNRINSYSRGNKDYWSFRGNAVREHAHAYLQYPAMMVPQMQGELIRIIRELVPSIKSVYDPFMGSGTVMTESMLQGLNFEGQDINPLAVLICQAKKGPFFEKALHKKIGNLLKNIADDDNNDIDIDFPNIFKWFRMDIAVKLSRIRRAIKKESAIWGRRFFWLALAETIRLSGNSRTSTFKLHIRPGEDIRTGKISPLETFERILCENYQKFLKIKNLLEKKGLINNSYFTGSVKVRLGDSAKPSTVNGNGKERFDLIVTSPPYGDNKTTVPYGQYSYLPLQWIDMSDIHHNMDNSFLSSTHEIDSRSLGGLRKNVLKESLEIEKISKTFSETIKNLGNEPTDRKTRVAAFCRDLDKCIDPILDALKPNAYMIWTIGNRQVGKKLVPMDDILSELLMARGAQNIITFQRVIPSKRMAVKNNIAATMRKETMMVFKKGNF
jgi:DNA modification methylase